MWLLCYTDIIVCDNVMYCYNSNLDSRAFISDDMELHKECYVLRIACNITCTQLCVIYFRLIKTTTRNKMQI